MKKIINEAETVAQQKNITLLYPNIFERIQLICKATAPNRSSMLQDILKGKKTEIEYINGAIVREAKKNGLRAPFNEAITYLIHSVEQLEIHFRDENYKHLNREAELGNNKNRF